MKYLPHILGLAALAATSSVSAAALPDPQALLQHYLSGDYNDGDAPLNAVMGYFQYHDQELREVLSNQSPELVDILESASYCYAAVATKPGPDLLPELFHYQDGRCLVVQDEVMEQGRYYSDSQCRIDIDYKTESDIDFCVREFDHKAEKYGSTADLHSTRDAWMPGYSATLPVTTRPQSFSEIPLLQRSTYKRVHNEQGTCHLEMRVYKNMDQHSATPIMLIHGGGWLARLKTARLMEAQIAQLTEAGFVVYMPFYRLAQEQEAGPACNNVSIEDSKNDIRDAYLWVLFNNYKYTHSFKSIRLLGQSAGGHMAVWLSQQFPFLINKIAPMFPVADFAHQLKELQDGSYTHSYIKNMLAILSGKSDWQELSGNEPLIVNNSLLDYIEQYPGIAPDMFISHGMADVIVSPSQSLRLCNALSGDINGGPAQVNALNFNQQYAQIQCRSGSELHLLENAGHHFDGCGLGLCDVGGEQGSVATKALMENMVNWLK
ncbi:hypothetical protein CWB99_08550 [Pseudoalteromonas rubra]|uniref:BD-FAE-like domain-containing protein n=1 Tax=Pseudoalteromonas rubra TaxID=43658 RepID=A0A5S3WQ47_9GAMM|nr:alpha/beta hydrolase [Pseudoalteromonas rubra]TMP29640.1 hypothetical protein CWB99_08550 [Pseudoalteromonas rubra]TMP35233.1 hypothetical protein CWC00_05515 [Pseudoalteromonas rubra]